MTSEDLRIYARRKPFLPFRMVLTTGETFDVQHPDLIMVGERSAVIGITNNPNKAVYNRSFLVDLLHVVGVEELPASSTTANGSSA